MKIPNILKEENETKLSKVLQLKDCAEKILKSTIQFFFDNAKTKKQGAGSGVLFQVNHKYFIFTAAHVYTENHKEIYVISNKEAISLGGMLYTTPLPITGIRTHDKFDIAIIEMNDPIANKIKKDYNFINLFDLELGHYVDINTNYLLAGYPISKTKKVWKQYNILQIEPFVANLDTLVRFDYKKYGFDVKTHIAIDYNGKLITQKNKNPHLGPNLEGISGSGLWHLYFSKKEKIIQAKLIGIIIEQIKENENKAIVATRIDGIIKFLNVLLDLQILIPNQSKKYE